MTACRLVREKVEHDDEEEEEEKEDDTSVQHRYIDTYIEIEIDGWLNENVNTYSYIHIPSIYS